MATFPTKLCLASKHIAREIAEKTLNVDCSIKELNLHTEIHSGRPERERKTKEMNNF